MPGQDLPQAFRQRLEEIVPGEHLVDVFSSFYGEKPTAFRLNPLSGSTDNTRASLEAASFSLIPVSWYDEAFLIPPEQRRSLTESDHFYNGQLYIQELSSMVAPQVLSPRPGEAVLDLAAAPGGKTLQLASLMDLKGRLVAVEVVKNRYYRLKRNLARYGAGQTETYLMDGRAAGRRWPELFDRVLLDAPCSSEARFTCLDPASWRYWSPRKVKESAHKQKRLLRAALQCLRPGGSLVYCTCSFSAEENELVVNSQLRAFPDLVEIQEIDLPLENVQAGLTRWRDRSLHPDLAKCVRILPNSLMDGFFICRLKKSASFLNQG